MTAKIDTQAPERICTWDNQTYEDGEVRVRGWTISYPAGHPREYIHADVAAAREAAAWLAGRDTAAAEAERGCETAPLSRSGLMQAIADSIRDLSPPTDTTALDRLIAERVRDARNTAWDEAADIMDGYGQHGYAEEFRARICAARGSKEGRDG